MFILFCIIFRFKISDAKYEYCYTRIFVQFDTQRRKCMQFSTMNSFLLTKPKCRHSWWTLNMPRAVESSARRHAILKDLDGKGFSCFVKITASVENDATYVICIVINCRPDDAVSKFIENSSKPVATWFILISTLIRHCCRIINAWTSIARTAVIIPFSDA